MENLPARKKMRLGCHDYHQNDAYFITICVKDRHEMLGRIDVVGANCVRPRLSEIGTIVENEISVLSSTYNNVAVSKHVIMPNHIHMILSIDNEGRGRTQFAPTVSQIMKQFKGSITKKVGFSIWQKSYYDHIIRSEEEYWHIWQYIDENPAKWNDDEYNQ